MNRSLSDGSTVAAVSTPAGSGGIAVIRISGPEAFRIAGVLWKGKALDSIPSHSVRLGTLTDESGEALDQVVATVYRAPNSYTGEDTVELSLHGSPWLQRRALEALVAAGAEPAPAGEFTRRAFLNGRLDLAQVEGVADLIAADSRASARVALRQVSGSFSSRLTEMRERLVELASLLELELDFSEEDVEFADRKALRSEAEELRQDIRRLADSYRRGRIYKEGLPVALAGVPNAGKSSLLNILLEEEKALVTDIPGTTRDIIEDTVEIDGLLMRFFDTAGLHTTDDPVERLGIDRARDRIRRAAAVLWLIDPTQPLEPQLKEMRETDIGEAQLIPVLTKEDINTPLSPSNAQKGLDEEESLRLYEILQKQESLDEEESLRIHEILQRAISISSRTGAGIDRLRHELRAIPGDEENPGETLVSNLRHYRELTEALPYLDRLLDGLDTSLPTDLLAMELRGAIRHLSAILGTIDNETLLSTIFSRFCIGK